MAYNDKNMVNDYNGHKIPQYYNPVTDRYEPLHGADGVSFVGNHVLSPGGVWIPQTGNDDGSINTRVTGSIVELDVVELGTVSAGATVEVGVYDSDNLDGLLVWVSTGGSGGRAGKFSIRFVHLSDSAHQDTHRNQIYTTPETLRSYNSDQATQIITKDYVSFKTDKMRVTITNGAEEDSQSVIAIVYGRLR